MILQLRIHEILIYTPHIDQQYIVERSIYLLQGLLQIAIVKQWLSVTSCIMEMQQELLQAIYPGESSVKQLPHITTPLLRRYYRSKKKHIHSAKQVLSLSESERKNFLEGLSKEQCLDVVDVANRIPQLKVSKAVLKGLYAFMITQHHLLIRLTSGGRQDRYSWCYCYACAEIEKCQCYYQGR